MNSSSRGSVLILVPGQALMLSAIVLSMMLATLSAGWLYDRFGWNRLNLVVIPALLAAPIAVIVIEPPLRRAATT